MAEHIWIAVISAAIGAVAGFVGLAVFIIYGMGLGENVAKAAEDSHRNQL